MTEIIKDIQGYEGIYTINNYGVIKNKKGIIIKPFKTQDGYLRVILSSNKTRKHYLVHRLVAISFLSNENNYPIINHKDENKENNYVCINDDGSINYNKSNLEWCTYRYNICYNNLAKKKALKISKKVRQFSLDGKLITTFYSSREAQRVTGINASNILLCCKKSSRYSQVGGFIWRFADDDLNAVIVKDRRIEQYSLQGQFIRMFDTQAEAARTVGVVQGAICNCLNGKTNKAGGYIWKWKQSSRNFGKK